MTAAPVSLGYLVVQSGRMGAWRDFATRLLGMEAIEEREGLRLRMDERAARVFVEPGGEERFAAAGWELADADALAALAERLGAEAGPPDLAESRRVAAVAVAHDPEGNRLEFFHGPQAAETPFHPGRPVSGFRTGDLGLGHLALVTARAEEMAAFYGEVLGFRLSDFSRAPFAASFFHLNSRHHSLALIEGTKAGVHHLMVELDALDDVGQAYDLAMLEDDRVAVTLGRHSNDFMTSFYMRSPSGFMVEYGWGGRSIDPGRWQAVECSQGPSLWGHERSWLGPEVREQVRRMRLAAAASGLRAPDFLRGQD